MEQNTDLIGLTSSLNLLLSTNINSDALVISADEVLSILHEAKKHFLNQPSLLKISSDEAQLESPLVIFGDLHGNLKSLLDILQKNGKPPKVRYLGLGDYVSRGAHSVEVFLILVAMSILYPQHVYLLRGGHESKAISAIYGFTDELNKKGINSAAVKEAFWGVFDLLPYAAVVNHKYFCVHGGISPNFLQSEQPLEAVRSLPRGTDVPDEGSITDLLYGDPLGPGELGFHPNPRGLGHCFGRNVLEEFLQKTKLTALIRSREYINTGYNQIWDHQVYNVFSSANYLQSGEPTGYYILDNQGNLEGKHA